MANREKFSQEEKEYIRQQYSLGRSVNSLAVELGSSFDTVKKVVKDNFINQQNCSSSKKIIECPDLGLLVSMVNDPDIGIKEICENFDVSRTVIYRWIKENNLEIVRKKPPTKLDQDVYGKLSDKEWILEHYNLHGTKKLSQLLDISDGTVARYLEKFGIARDKVFSSSISELEKEIGSFISNYFTIITNKRTIAPPYELDIFIPEKNIAIEFNGLYWHSEQNKPQSYHYDKWLACRNAGVQLIQIWEDDWEFKRELVERMLLHKFGISKLDKIYARKCNVISLTHSELNDFMAHNHIQGSPHHSSVRLGLIYEDDIVAAISFVKSKEYYTLTRYATSQIVVGGFTKLLKHFENLNLTNRIVTFADLTISNGGLYENSGFELDKILTPDYSYYVASKRVHKFNYRKDRFKNDPKLQYENNLTERELAKLNKIYRIYDAGKARYIKNLDDN